MTERQKRFAEEYIKTNNATESAKNAGYSVKTAYSIGNELLKKLEIKKYIENINESIKNKNIMEIEDLQEFLTSVIKSNDSKTFEKLKAVELLGKSKAMFVDKREITTDTIIKVNIENDD